MLTLLDAVDAFSAGARPVLVYVCVCMVVIPLLLVAMNARDDSASRRRQQQPDTF